MAAKEEKEMPQAKNKKELESRSYSFEIRAEEGEKGNVIEGRPIVYEQKTDIGPFDEIIEKGALDKTDLTDVRFLINHDLSKIPLARSRKNTDSSTMKLTVDDKGLGIRVTLDTENNADARSLYSAVKRGDITGMSFMFSVEADAWEDEQSDHPLRRIQKIGTVVECSAVTFPAYPQTSIDARSEQAAVETAAQKVLENARAAHFGKSVETDIELAKAKNRNILLTIEKEK